MDSKTAGQPLRESTRILIRKLGVLERGEAECCGVTYAQCHAIVETGRRQKVSLNELADILNLDKSTVSKTVDQLVNKQILLRQPDPADRRYIILQLTDQGKEVFRNIEKRMEAYFTEILNAIPAEKQTQVVESLQLLSGALKGLRCC